MHHEIGPVYGDRACSWSRSDSEKFAWGSYRLQVSFDRSGAWFHPSGDDASAEGDARCSKTEKFGGKGDFVGVPNFARPKDDVAGIKCSKTIALAAGCALLHSSFFSSLVGCR
jgi:hypothetical protein